MGYFTPKTNEIFINKYILEQWTNKEIINDVIKHELMHALSYQIRKDSKYHDKKFKEICEQCGVGGNLSSAKKK